jgi:predicted nucleic acid-binding protein
VRALEALDDYFCLPIGRHGHQSLLMRVLELRRNFGAYDATYVALAEILRGELVTADGRLAKATRAHSKITVHGA